jgi:hypothetical protein
MQDRSVLQMLHHQLRSVFAFWLEHRYGVLFCTLFLTLVGFPLLATLGFDQTPMIVLLAASLGAALVGMSSRHLSRLMLVLLGVMLVVRFVAGSVDWHRMIAASTVALVVLGFVAGIDTVRVAMNSTRVSGELLFAALSVYLLVGILFAMLHCAVAALWHDAYSLPEGGRLALPAGIYFSFMTQTTVGYGDILPKSDLARGLAMVQAIAGQLYLSVMVARLVGLYMAGQKHEGGAT